MDINFVLSQTDSRPMYQQIVGHIKDRITVGDWPANTRLPSIRELAVALKVSVITVKRAYQELEHEGVISLRHGRGAFVSADHKVGVKLMEKELEDHLQKAAQIAELLEMDQDTMEEKLKKAMDQEMETPSCA